MWRQEETLTCIYLNRISAKENKGIEYRKHKKVIAEIFQNQLKSWIHKKGNTKYTEQLNTAKTLILQNIVRLRNNFKNRKKNLRNSQRESLNHQQKNN